ncbi:hypothetical protein F441_08182 [Phytophthora nicotianae CJ01A1]|uniref:Uncharacterized protein n=6 Tax=Phytophthora nicotianae TaxID=4792 RepID=W2QAF3_PHYN3|nr:hypothetical protein PPTG_11406 [Phytophthora nicotianae INRA-310]ETK87542.1 hypothetical protein L915_08033 [Phytophthora nicotianae]ETO76312.1 hypothetical protein F444_08262 [Phytophthora nicotianae P1976]ETP17413.1 hypothetical protein F441_08182 [Phytophthora nicotianae CJ01A1]ETP45424.1 hypothetical protein F442_08147 [Phytophthora nicotianae P10297]ETL40971.1 hypothetical protein L916_07956 [Phytophthora nicotianae]
MNISDLLCSPAAPRVKMNISDILCSPVETQVTPISVTPQTATCEPPKRPRAQSKKRQNKFVPDDQRKRPYRMSVTQKKCRQEFRDHESKVFNLTLDINDLKQQVQYLLECRDLQVTCLLQTRQRLEAAVLGTVDRILFGGSDRPRSGDEGCSFSRMFMDQSDGSTPPNGVYEFCLQLDKPNFNHRSCSIATTQVLSVVEEDPEGDNEDAAEVRKICGDPGGCLVEAVGEFTGRFTRQIIVSMFPHVLSDEMMVAQIIGLSITCPARLLLYFNAHKTIVRQVAQADVFAALAALQQAKPQEFAAIMGTAAA